MSISLNGLPLLWRLFFRIRRISRQCDWTQFSYSSIVRVQTRYYLICWGLFCAAVYKRQGNAIRLTLTEELKNSPAQLSLQ